MGVKQRTCKLKTCKPLTYCFRFAGFRFAGSGSFYYLLLHCISSVAAFVLLSTSARTWIISINFLFYSNGLNFRRSRRGRWAALWQSCVTRCSTGCSCFCFIRTYIFQILFRWKFSFTNLIRILLRNHTFE